MQRKPSWFRRLFRRSKKSDKSAPYVMTREDEDEALVKVVRSGSDPELSGSKRDRLLEGEAKGEAGQLQRRKQRSDKSSRQTKALSTAFEHITTTGMVAPLWEQFILILGHIFVHCPCASCILQLNKATLHLQ